MASATTPKPHKTLGEFLSEQQGPFILEAYLSECDYSKRWSFNEGSSDNSEKPSTSGLNKKKTKALLLFGKALKALCNKLAFHKDCKNILTKDRILNQRNKRASVPEPARVDYNNVQFSSSSSSTMFNSCYDIDDEGASIWSHQDHHWLYSHNSCNMRLQRRQQQRSILGYPESLGNIPLTLSRVPNLNEEVRRMQQIIRSSGVFVPKKITEDSLLSATIWSLLGQSIKKENCTKELEELLQRTNDASQILKSKRVMHRIKKMLFDCVRDMKIALPTEEDKNRQFVGPLEGRKLISQRTKAWGQQVADGTNLAYLLTLDYLNSIMEWSKFEPYVKAISVEITDAILDDINNEIISELTATWTLNIQNFFY